MRVYDSVHSRPYCTYSRMILKDYPKRKEENVNHARYQMALRKQGTKSVRQVLLRRL